MEVYRQSKGGYMAGSDIKVSIIMPCYNAQEYFEQCLKSAVGQTLKDIEIIVVDDGSSDGSLQIMESWKKKDSRIRVIHKQNSGYGNSMNRGLEAARGEYIGIIESDDYVVSEMYETLYALTQEGAADVVKASFWDCYDEKDGSVTKVLNTERRNMPDVDGFFTIREYPQILWGHPSIWTGIYRRQFLLDNNIRFKEVKGGGWVDNPFFFETLCCAKKIRWTKQPLYCYRKTNASSSSVGYDLKIPFERMLDNLDAVEKHGCADETTLKFLYARALMYLIGATQEPHYAWSEDYARPYMQKMLSRLKEDVIKDDFNFWDQKTYYKYSSPLNGLMPDGAKLLIYNWIPFDAPSRAGGGVSLYCRNLIEALLKYRPDVQVYFLSSGWAYDITKKECYFRRLGNVYGKRVRSFEIVNSPVPAPQDMLLYNPSSAKNGGKLKEVFADFVKKNGPFNTIHFNNIEGLSLDVFDLKKEMPQTKFVYSMHNYVPICMTGFYFRRDKKCICSPSHTPLDCAACIAAEKEKRQLKKEMILRGQVNCPDKERYDGEAWAKAFAFDTLDETKGAQELFSLAAETKASINKNMDLVLCVSQRVSEIAKSNGIDEKLIKTSYIGTKIAQYQVRRSAAPEGGAFTLAFLGSGLDNTEKGYPFLIDSLAAMDEAHAKKTNLILTTTTQGRDEELLEKLEKFQNVKIIHGYSHSQLPEILKYATLGVVPVLWEDNLPQVAIEMVALGVPVLSSSAGGASELCGSRDFCFEAGNQKDFLEKLEYFIDHPDAVKEYWPAHKGLVTMEEHFREMEVNYSLPPEKTATITAQQYSKLLAENAFLYEHFEGSAGRMSLEQENEMKAENENLKYQISEIWNSKSFKAGRVLTAPARWLREGRHKK